MYLAPQLTLLRSNVDHEQTYKFMYFGALSMSNFRLDFLWQTPPWVPKCVDNWLSTPDPKQR